MQTISVRTAKAQFYRLIDAVAGGEEIVITKHRRPVARLAPVAPTPAKHFVGRMRGTVKILGDIVAPDGGDWDVDADL